jgi:hypothetical protein
MNMREFWANEAAMMRDKSGLLGKEVLMPVSNNPTARKVVNFDTGYWQEASKTKTDTQVIVCSIKYYNQIKLSNINECLLEAKRIFKTFSKGEYEFDIRFEEISSIVYDHSKYGMSGLSLTQLPLGYFMEFVDGIGTGLTEPNPTNPFSSSHFYIKSGSLANVQEIGRVIVHETLHPLLDHSWIEAPNPIKTITNPIAGFYKKLKEATWMYKEEEAQKAGSITDYIKKNLLKEAKIFAKNIMTTPEYVIPPFNFKKEAEYILNALDIKISKDTDYNIMNEGYDLHELQFNKIVSIVPLKKK